MALALFLCAAIADVVPDPGARADAGPPPPSRHTATIKRLAQAAAVHGKLEPAIVLPHLDAALAARRAVPVPRAELELPANVTGIRVASSVLAVINRSYATHLAKLAARHDAVKQELTRLRSRAAVPKGLTR